MPSLLIQIQPGRAADLHVDTVCRRCQALTKVNPAIGHFTVVRGNDDGPYVNLNFETSDLGALWRKLEIHVYGDPLLGGLMRQASIATCEGSRGWDDYLLLHHFDRTLRLDRLPGD